MSTFFTFDGIDGTGKSTQSDLFCAWLSELGCDVSRCRDPGSTPLGESLRKTLLHDRQIEIGRRAETLIYMAARAQLVEETIRPALLAGKTVVSDRFLLANVAYQAYGGELPVDAVRGLGQFATEGLSPDCTFLLDMNVSTALSRLGHDADRLEGRGVDYFSRVRQGFLVEAQRHNDRIWVIDANGDVDEIQSRIREISKRFLAAT